MHKHFDMPFQIKAVADDGTFSGYGSVFNVVDAHKEIVVPGAFTDSLKAKQPSMLWQHRSGEPCGVYKEVREDAVGLYVEGKLALKTVRGAEAYELLKIGALSGMSIGFNVREESYDRVSGINTLKKLDLWEISLVTFPANDAARITDVKAAEQIETLKDAEAYLRDAGGFSKAQALALIARIKAAHARSDSEAELAKTVDAIKRATAVFATTP